MKREIDIEELKTLARQACVYFFNQEHAADITVKGRSDFVTGADMKVQEYLYRELSGRYPDIQFMSEEKDNADVDFSGAVWILDPVDGTTNLIHDFRDSGLSLALCEQGEVTMALIYQPFSGEMFTACRGGGAWCNGKRIFVSKENRLENSLVSIGTSPYHRELADANFTDFRRIFDSCADIRRMGAASIDLAYVACGRTEAYFERNLKPWDFAAGMLLVEEAGGRVLDLNGKRANPLQPGDILAGNGSVELQLLKQVLN